MFLWVDAKDAKFDPSHTQQLLQELDADHVELVVESPASSRIPRGLVLGSIVLASLALVPPAMIAKARSTTSDKPRVHNFFDMDFQPKFKTQTTSPLFADGRSMRPPVAGTVARGQLPEDLQRMRGTVGGVDPFAAVAQEPSDGSGTADPLESVPWLDTIPLTVNESMMQRGRQQFNIHCSLCHGRVGDGNGLVAVRARELQQSTWVPPTSLHMDYVREQPVGQLYNTITNGIRKMPAYKNQIPVDDRWAIVAYVKALQRSQSASLEDVPADQRDGLREIQ
jgi:mono/diheme cytochrome c family protein